MLASARKRLLSIFSARILDSSVERGIPRRAAELNIRKSNLVRFETRREQPGLATVTVRDLLKAALRHRPDRIIVGEVRGGEAFDLLQALNTGHAGSLCTLHANSARQLAPTVPPR